MIKPILYRKRVIPNELIPLHDDTILVQKENLIITKWITLHPRRDIAWGISAYYIDKGFKVSKIFDKENHLVYWYCDIIHTIYDLEQNTILFEDLLLDVILYENGKVQVMDLDELADAMDMNLISQNTVKDALRTLDSLLKIIYSGKFDILAAPVNEAELLIDRRIDD